MTCRRTVSNAARLAILTAVLLLPAASVAGGEPLLNSGSERVALLELYTSQGCSSCPPADRWLSRLQDLPGLWSEVVPVAFHVDYWDYIGWRDPFSSRAFSERQRDYAREGGVGTVYTPGVLLNGKEWRTWRMTDRPRPPRPKVGSLALVRRADTYVVTFRPVEPKKHDLRVTVALLGFDVLSEVTAGENRGRNLLNDFIVLDWRDSRMRHESGVWSAELPVFDEESDIPRLALAAWVSAVGLQAPLQATGGWLE